MIIRKGSWILVAALFASASALAQQVQSGEQLYRTHCAACHSGDGSSSSEIAQRLRIRDLRSPEVQGMTDEQLADAIGRERGWTHGYGKYFSNEQLSMLARYIRSLAPESKSPPVHSASE